MKVKFIKELRTDTNEAILNITDEEETVLHFYHANNLDGGRYGYNFKVEGTEEEIKIITEFCEKVNIAGWEKV